ncbi:MAG: sensor histidine kinase, partial [Bacteroidetes bacterium]|nr:sensor histidine kinase [Bacteroidota bacterium]
KAYYDLANLYKNANEFDKQLDCGRKALQAAEKSGIAEDRFISYTIIVHAYTNLAENTKAAAARDSGLRYYSTSYDYLVRIAFHLVSGSINMSIKELDKAKADFSTAISLAKEGKQVFSLIQSEMQLARVLTLQKKFGEAEKILLSADSAIAKTNENTQRITLLQYYAELYEEAGDPGKAIGYYKKYIALNDSLTSLENRKYVNELETKYETGKKEAQIAQMGLERQVQQLTIRQKSTLNYVLAGLAAVLLISSLLVYKNYRQKQRLQQQRIAELETEKQLTATEAVLKGEELERTRLAKDLHDGLGGMLSGIKYSLDTMKRNQIMTPENQQAFERSIDMLDSSIQEMRRVAHNMMPESLVNFGIDAALRDFCDDMTQTGAIKVTYQSIGLQGEAITQTTAIAIYRIVQELINNIMKHAAATTAIVQLSKKGAHLSITVEDNGKGFDPSKLEPLGFRNEGRGMGWVNIQNRIDLLKGKLDVKSLPGNGTSVLIEFNV